MSNLRPPQSSIFSTSHCFSLSVLSCPPPSPSQLSTPSLPLPPLFLSPPSLYSLLLPLCPASALLFLPQTFFFPPCSFLPLLSIPSSSFSSSFSLVLFSSLSPYFLFFSLPLLFSPFFLSL